MSMTKLCRITSMFGIFLETNKHQNLTRCRFLIPLDISKGRRGSCLLELIMSRSLCKTCMVRPAWWFCLHLSLIAFCGCFLPFRPKSCMVRPRTSSLKTKAARRKDLISCHSMFNHCRLKMSAGLSSTSRKTQQITSSAICTILCYSNTLH